MAHRTEYQHLDDSAAEASTARDTRIAIWDTLRSCAYCKVTASAIHVVAYQEDWGGHPSTFDVAKVNAIQLVPVCSGHADMRVDRYATDILRTIEGN